MIALSDRHEFESFRANLFLHICHVEDGHAMSAANQFTTDRTKGIYMSSYRRSEYAEVLHQRWVRNTSFEPLTQAALPRGLIDVGAIEAGRRVREWVVTSTS